MRHTADVTDSPEVADLIAYLRVASEPRDGMALRRIAIIPDLGIGRAAVRHVEEFAMRHRISFLESLRRAPDNDALSDAGRDAIGEFLLLVDRLGDVAGDGPCRVLETVLEAGYRTIVDRDRDTRAQSAVAEFVAAVEEYEQNPPAGIAGFAGRQRTADFASAYPRQSAWRARDNRQRMPRWQTIHLAFSVLAVVAFLWVAVAVVELESVDARIVSLVPGMTEGDLVEFEYDGEDHRVGVRGYTDASEGDVVQVWFWSYNPSDVTYERQRMFVIPAVVAAVLVTWVVWAIRLMYWSRSQP